MRRLLIVLCASALAACGHVPLSSIPKLSRLDMMTLDIEALRVAVEMPDELLVRRNSAIITVGLKESAGEPALQERFVLQQIPTDEVSGARPAPAANAQIFRIAEADLARLTALRDLIRIRKTEDPDGTKGFLTVTSAACRLARLPAGPLPVTTMLRTEPDEAYFIMTRNVDLRTLQSPNEIPVCRS